MKKTTVIVLCLVVFGLAALKAITIVTAEQRGNSPESGVTSRLGTLVSDLISKGYGSVSAIPGVGDWGSMWNRIYTAATWTPSDVQYNLNANLVPENVPEGLSFYSGSNRTIQYGTGMTNFKNQSLCGTELTPDGSCNQTLYEPTSPASTWSNTNTLSGQVVWKDDRTGLYWTEIKPTGANLSGKNQFLKSECDFFSTNPRSNYSGNDIGTGNQNCGPSIDAINFCATLSQARISGGETKTDWYLPSKAELLQAWKDNMYNKAGSTQANANAFTTTNYHWSSSERTVDSRTAWNISLYDGTNISTDFNLAYKSYGNSVRCVSRD